MSDQRTANPDGHSRDAPPAAAAVRLDFEPANGVATLTLAMPGPVNKIDDVFVTALAEALRSARGHEGLTGIVIATAHKDFCVGADIDGLYAEHDAATMFARVRALQALYRSIETVGVPVVACLTGSALGGGYEVSPMSRAVLVLPFLLLLIVELRSERRPRVGAAQAPAA